MWKNYPKSLLQPEKKLNKSTNTWNDKVNGCSNLTTAYISHGATKDISDSGGSSRGDVTLKCTDGSISNSGELCIAYTAKSTSFTWCLHLVLSF